MRKAANIDLTQRAIVSALRAAGFSVFLTPVGAGFPDAVVALRDWLCLVEFKSRGGKHGGRRGTFTPAQIRFREQWPSPIIVLDDPATAVSIVLEYVKC